ncbi:MAG: nicotinate-nucleotide adenylyltransferase [Deltaproteobacteria bacterium]|nr:nicotinate-nucleotide adenylyltransferase [Deltaproteobacteria bacterium]
MLDTGVIHGRFQVLHNDHLKYILAGKSRCRHLIVGITNPDPHLTKEDPADPQRSLPLNNPLTYYERYTIIREALQEADIALREFSLVPFPINLPDLYRYYLPLESTFFLTIYDSWGKRKLEQFKALGLQTEILWVKPLEQKGLSAAGVRQKMVSGDPWAHLVPPSTRHLLEAWDIPGRLRKLNRNHAK